MSLSFSQPWALWLLAALPAILWLHRRRQPAPALLVPSLTLFLPFSVRRLPSRSRLQASLLLAAHLVAATAAAAGASGIGRRLQPGAVAFVVDATPSMGAAGRWLEAREAVSQLAALRRGPFSLILLDPDPRLLVHGTLDGGELSAFLAGTAPADPRALRRPPDTARALDLAARLAPGGEVWVVGDPGLALPSSLPEGLKLRRVGEARPNQGIVAALWRPDASGSSLWLQTAGAPAGPAGGRLRVEAAGRPLWEDASAGGSSEGQGRLLSFPGLSDSKGLVAILAADDALAADDRWEIDPGEGRLRVQVLGAPPALVDQLSAFPDVTVDRRGRAEAGPPGAADVSIVCGEGTESEMPDGPVLRLGSSAARSAARRLDWAPLPPWLVPPQGEVRLRASALGPGPGAGDAVIGHLGNEEAAWLTVADGRPVLSLALDPAAPELLAGRGWPRLLRWSLQLLLALRPAGATDPALAILARSDESLTASETRQAPRNDDEGRGPALASPWRLAGWLFLAACFGDLLLRQGRRGAGRRGPAGTRAGSET